MPHGQGWICPVSTGVMLSHLDRSRSKPMPSAYCAKGHRQGSNIVKQTPKYSTSFGKDGFCFSLYK